MEISILKDILENYKNDKLSIDEAVDKFKMLPFENLGFAKVDHHRKIRNGFPEVVYCEGKTIFQIKEIFKKLVDKNPNVFGTRANEKIYNALKEEIEDCIFYEEARIVAVKRNNIEINNGYIVVVTAGTSDIPVAEEAAITVEMFGYNVKRLFDVGVAGIHRLLAYTEILMNANVIIVVAGMEGALASVVGGLVDKPVISVPTSIGYGANLGGIAPLLTMLNSCASGIGVVNIDNGFGAGYLASVINRQIK